MPQSLAQIYLHIVFSTKHRYPFLKGQQFRQRVHAYLTGICKNLCCSSLQTGGVEDHVHILCRFGKGIALQDLLRDLKRDSSILLVISSAFESFGSGSRQITRPFTPWPSLQRLFLTQPT